MVNKKTESENYRDNLAGHLKNLRSSDLESWKEIAKTLLDSEERTETYQNARKVKLWENTKAPITKEEMDFAREKRKFIVEMEERYKDDPEYIKELGDVNSFDDIEIIKKWLRNIKFLKGIVVENDEWRNYVTWDVEKLDKIKFLKDSIEINGIRIPSNPFTFWFEKFLNRYENNAEWLKKDLISNWDKKGEAVFYDDNKVAFVKIDGVSDKPVYSYFSKDKAKELLDKEWYKIPSKLEIDALFDWLPGGDNDAKIRSLFSLLNSWGYMTHKLYDDYHRSKRFLKEDWTVNKNPYVDWSFRVEDSRDFTLWEDRYGNYTREYDRNDITNSSLFQILPVKKY